MFIRDTFFLYNKLNGKLILSVLVVVSLLISCSFNKEPLEARLLEKELYDHNNDPDELNNLYNNKRYTDIEEQLEKELISLRKRYKVPNN